MLVNDPPAYTVVPERDRHRLGSERHRHRERAGGERDELAVSGTTVYAGGNFTSIGNLPREGIACLTEPQTVDAPVPEPVAEIAFTRIGPNPTTGQTRMHFELPRAAHVRITVFDVLGRRVARPADALHPAGRHVSTWDGRARGERAGAGVYFVRFEAEGLTRTRRLVLMR